MRPSQALKTHRQAVLAILGRYPLTNARVFGSTARGEDVEGSDLDIMVERGGLTSYTQIFEIEDALTSLLGVKVDLRTSAEFGASSTARIADDLTAL